MLEQNSLALSGEIECLVNSACPAESTDPIKQMSMYVLNHVSVDIKGIIRFLCNITTRRREETGERVGWGAEGGGAGGNKLEEKKQK